jgi:hypothetical protein
VKRAEPPGYRVLLKRNDFVEAGSLLLRLAKPKNGEEALLFYEDGRLVIDLGGMSSGVPTHGSWLSGVRTSAVFILSLFRVPPEEEEIVVSFDGTRLKVGNSSMDASATSLATEGRTLPMDLTDAQLLAWSINLSDGELQEAGYEVAVKSAWIKSEEQIAKAVKPLERYGISKDDLREMLTRKLQRHKVGK